MVAGSFVAAHSSLIATIVISISLVSMFILFLHYRLFLRLYDALGYTKISIKSPRLNNCEMPKPVAKSAAGKGWSARRIGLHIGGSFLAPCAAAGCLNPRRFLDESYRVCSTGRTRFTYENSAIELSILLCISEAHENFVEQTK